LPFHFKDVSYHHGKAIGEIFKMERRKEKSLKWKGDRRNLQNGKAIGEIFKMERL
jgi:hypothetical protein